jgi:hypothetical protein
VSEQPHEAVKGAFMRFDACPLFGRRIKLSQSRAFARKLWEPEGAAIGPALAADAGSHP